MLQLISSYEFQKAANDHAAIHPVRQTRTFPKLWALDEAPEHGRGRFALSDDSQGQSTERLDRFSYKGIVEAQP
jgi:hypothetical protein